MIIDTFIKYIEYYKKTGRLKGNEVLYANNGWLYVYEDGEETMLFNCSEKGEINEKD